MHMRKDVGEMMERISREQMLMEVAQVVARRGTCSRAQVGVVFARDGRILATGYNGAPPGMAHCVHESAYIGRGASAEVPDWLWKLWDSLGKENRMGSISVGTSYHWDGHTLTVGTGRTDPPGCTVVEHAERNGIAYAAREGIRLGDSDAYCTHAPCLECARALLSTGIRSLSYKTPYRLTAGVELLREQGIQVVDLSEAR